MPHKYCDARSASASFWGSQSWNIRFYKTQWPAQSGIQHRARSGSDEREALDSWKHFRGCFFFTCLQVYLHSLGRGRARSMQVRSHLHYGWWWVARGASLRFLFPSCCCSCSIEVERQQSCVEGFVVVGCVVGCCLRRIRR